MRPSTPPTMRSREERRRVSCRLQRVFFPGIFQHLPLEILWIRNRDVNDLSAIVEDRLELRLNESGVRREIQAIDACDNLVAKRGIEMNAVRVEQRARRVVIAR